MWFCTRSFLNFLIYEENFLFFFTSVHCTAPIQFCNKRLDYLVRLWDINLVFASFSLWAVYRFFTSDHLPEKGLAHQIDIFCGPIKSVLFEHAQVGFKLLAWLVKQKNKCKVSACFFESTYFTASNFCSGFSLVEFLQYTFMAGFRKNFRIAGGLS